MAKPKPKSVQKFRGRGIGVSKDRLTDVKTIAIIERRYQVVALRRDGYTHKEISDTLKISVQTVIDDLKAILNGTLIKAAETSEENRQLQIERLDKLLSTYHPFATQWHKEERVHPVDGSKFIVEVPPDPKYANLILAIEARRAKLLALDIPEVKKLDVSGVRIYEGVDLSEV